MNGLLLVSGDAFDRWLSRASQLANIRAAALQGDLKSGLTNSGYGEWWDRVKSQAEGSEFKRSGKTAVVDVVGALDYKYDLWSYFFDASCYKGIAAKVNAAAVDGSIERIVLYIDSPGGVHHGCPETAEAIWAARESGKEVVAVVDPEAASAGYWMASQASRIVAIKSAWVGSLGSQMMLYSMKKMYEKSGIDVELIRASISPNKNLGHPIEEISEGARAERQSLVDTAGNQFVEHVARGRGIKTADVLKNYGQGSMFFTAEAMERGMVDEIGTFESLLSSSDGDKKKKGPYGKRLPDAIGPE